MKSGQSAIAALGAAIALAPLLFGSVDPMAAGALCIPLGLALVLSPTERLGRPAWIFLGALAVLALVLGLVAWLQVSAGPWMPQDERAAISGLLAEAAGSGAGRYRPILALITPLALILALASGLVVGVGQRASRALVEVFLWSSAAYAAYGIAQHLIVPGQVLWMPKRGHFDDLTATFTNRNSAAIFFGMACIFGSLQVIRALESFGILGRGSWRGEGRLAVEIVPQSGAWRRLIVRGARLALCFIALLMTHSRAGTVLSVAACATAVALWLSTRDRKLQRHGKLALAVGAAVALLSVLLHARLNTEGFSDGSRWEAYRSAWTMVFERPWTGLGFGSFAEYFPAFRNTAMGIWGVWDRAHMTILQIAVEAGLPVAVLCFGFAAAVVFILARGAVLSRKYSYIVIGAFAISLLVLCHSLIDFSVQIPGVAIPFLALAGAGLSQVFSSGGGLSGGTGKHLRNSTK